MTSTDPASAPPPGIPLATEIMHPGEMATIRVIVALLRNAASSLRDDDVLGMAMISIGFILEGARVSRGKPVNAREFVECEGLGVIFVLSVEHEAARRSRILPELEYPAAVVQQHVVAWKERWFREYWEIVERGHQALPHSLRDAREREIVAFAVAHAEKRVQPIEDLLKTMRSAKHGAHGRQRLGRPRPEELESSELLADSKLVLSDLETLAKRLYVDREGRLALGRDQVRDALLKWTPERESEDQLRELVHRERPGPDPLDELAEAEMVEVVRGWRAARQAEVQAGSAAAIVIEHLPGLMSGEVRASDLADRHQLARSTLSEAYQQERGRLARELGRRGLG